MNTINKWIDEQVPDQLPKNVIGISFNLFENQNGFGIEIIGSSSFDETDEDWACDEIWEPKQRQFEIAKNISGNDWKSCLENMKNIVSEYLENGNKKSSLKQVQGIGIGFIDGDMEIIYKS